MSFHSISGHHLLLDPAAQVVVLHRQRHHPLRRHHLPLGPRLLLAVGFRRKGNDSCRMWPSYLICKLVLILNNQYFHLKSLLSSSYWVFKVVCHFLLIWEFKFSVVLTNFSMPTMLGYHSSCKDFWPLVLNRCISSHLLWYHLYCSKERINWVFAIRFKTLNLHLW